MELKDYYAILELKPPVSQAEIKKAYRKLAQIYHPDKTGTDPYAHSRFTDIKEAYEILTNPSRREEYHQQRWFFRSQGIQTSAETITPFYILKKMLALERRIARIDQFRSNHHPIVFEIEHLMSKENMEVLNTFNDQEINQEILRSVLRCMKYLPFKSISQLSQHFESFPQKNTIGIELSRYIMLRKKLDKWERLRTPLLLVLVAAICILIYFVSN